ncbi:MAG: hypothetical protein ACM37W_00500 [Actinomycetota bacterium]
MEPKIYTLAADDGAVYFIKEGEFILSYFDSENILITDEYGAFVIPLVVAFEAFTGRQLLPLQQPA